MKKVIFTILTAITFVVIISSCEKQNDNVYEEPETQAIENGEIEDDEI